MAKQLSNRDRIKSVLVNPDFFQSLLRFRAVTGSEMLFTSVLLFKINLSQENLVAKAFLNCVLGIFFWLFLNLGTKITLCKLQIHKYSSPCGPLDDALRPTTEELV